jgi:hypothetical protein
VARMADDVVINVVFRDGEPVVDFPAEGISVSVPLTLVGDRLYRVEGVPVLAERRNREDSRRPSLSGGPDAALKAAIEPMAT